MSRYIDIEPYERKPGGNIKEHTCRIEVKTVFANGFGTVHEQRVKTEDIPAADVFDLAEISYLLQKANEFVERSAVEVKAADDALEAAQKALSVSLSERDKLRKENDDLRKAIKTMQ